MSPFPSSWSFPRGWSWGSKLRWLLWLAVLYALLMLPVLFAVLVLREAAPRDLDCFVVGQGELYCQAVER